ncbi:TRAPP trafficking subunit Trs65-domain-containing protein [Phyllosticta citriasiana]|uniref:TRAPP trafficking subunit Trs65-domain-containing protein n=1 Tax=Phyllosticta citriasiana TaxID=595635 RepID=A0ABR1KCB6_9PEZI
MATVKASSHSRSTSGDFSDSSLVETVVPAASSIYLQKSLDSWDGAINESSTSILPFLSQRQNVDELVSVYVVLRTPAIDGETLRSYLARLSINVEAFATSTAPLSHQPGGGHPPPLKELLHTATVQAPGEPVLLQSKSVAYENGHTQEYCYVAWKAEVFLGHPRSRLPRPVVYFSVGASMKPAQQIKLELLEDEYLPSLAPLSGNLLEAFSRDPALQGIKPHLSASRITKVAPTATVERELLRPLQNAGRRMFRAVPALTWRLRYTKSYAPINDVSIFASFDFEVNGMAGYSLSLNQVDLSLSDGRVEACGHRLGADVSNTFRYGDQVVLLYKLIPNEISKDFTVPMHIHALDVRIRAKMLISEDCQPEVAIDWRTNVDVAHVLKTKLKVPDHLLGRSAHHRNSAGSPMRSPGPVSPTYTEGSQDSGAPGAIGLAITVSGPERVYVAEPFIWDIFIVNRAEKERQLEFQVIFKDRPRGKAPDLLLRTSRGLKIGIIGPLACKTTQIELEPFKDGILSLDFLRLVDVQTQEYADIRDLPTICLLANVPSRSGRSNDWRRIMVSGEMPETHLAAAVTHSPGATTDVIRKACDPQHPIMIEGQRRRLLRALNSRYIYGSIPLLHSIVFLLQMAAVSILVRKFNSYYANRPVLTTMVTNAILGGIADTVAQSVTAIRERAVRKPGGVAKDDFFAIEIHELDKKNPYPDDELIPSSKRLPPPFDFERLTRFMAYGFLMAPVQHKWFGFLSKTFPITKTSAFVPALKRVAFDQFLFAPVGLACFFTFMTVAEGGGKRAVTRKFQDVYVPALKANYVVWPAVQILNFRVMPIQFQIASFLLPPFVSTVGILWTAYLSLTNASDES